MLRLAGPRFLLYGLFIGAVAAAAALSHLGTGGIVVAMAATWLLLSALEWAVSRAVATDDDEAIDEEDRFRARPAPPRPARQPPAPEPVLPETVALPEVPIEPKPAPEPAASEPAPALVQDSGVPPDATPPTAAPEPQPVAPEPVPEARPMPDPAAQPVAAVVPQPEPESVPPPAPPPVPVLPVGGRGGREWNLWDLERLTRDAAGGDAFKDEERAYLLMYLREFANADGILPADFDGLIRDSFGDLVGVS